MNPLTPQPTLPQTIDCGEEFGFAKRKRPRGISDIMRIDPYGLYESESGMKLGKYYNGWVAAYKGHTTKYAPSCETAIAWLQERINNSRKAKK